MNLRDLRYLVALADERHFGKAAERCFVSQPTLSVAIKKLEDEVGLQLFTRTSRDVFPTEAGLLLADYARQMIGLRSEALQQLRRQIRRTA